MSTDNSTSADATAESGGGGIDWDQITSGGDGPAAPTAPAAVRAAGPAGAAVSNLPPTPPQTGLIAGRLPIQGDTGKAILRLPEPVKGLHCAVVMVNTGVLSDCYRPAKRACVPTALRGRPLNDAEIEVILDGGDHVARGLGWTVSSSYPGANLETRQIEVDVPYVEVLALVGVECGCDADKWADENDYQP
ncbi:MAG: hypothetical protein J2P26_00565 [Nocardiopsaceae bacterium]|nr:hypothetical protein [Nocardiopsaceae bacterium]